MTSSASFEDLVAQTIADDGTTHLPEVRSAAFRYFDGQTWSDSWNSLQRGSLPVAVEVQLSLRDRAEMNGRQRSGENPTASSGGTLATDSQAAHALDGEEPSAEEERSTYRFLVRLPTARKYPELKPSSSLALGGFVQGNPPTAPAADQLSGGEPPADMFSPGPPGDHAAENAGVFPDQWLRTAP
jgi:hypothetical protein